MASSMIGSTRERSDKSGAAARAQELAMQIRNPIAKSGRAKGRFMRADDTTTTRARSVGQESYVPSGWRTGINFLRDRAKPLRPRALAPILDVLSYLESKHGGQSVSRVAEGRPRDRAAGAGG